MIVLRVLVIVAVVAGFFALWTVHITLPALTVAGLVGWAVMASYLAVAAYRLYRKEIGR